MKVWLRGLFWYDHIQLSANCCGRHLPTTPWCSALSWSSQHCAEPYWFLLPHQHLSQAHRDPDFIDGGALHHHITYVKSERQQGHVHCQGHIPVRHRTGNITLCSSPECAMPPFPTALKFFPLTLSPLGDFIDVATALLIIPPLSKKEMCFLAPRLVSSDRQEQPKCCWDCP